jgi:hypothetical protein
VEVEPEERADKIYYFMEYKIMKRMGILKPQLLESLTNGSDVISINNIYKYMQELISIPKRYLEPRTF